MGLKDKLKTMSDDEKFALLATDGMIVKRPILIKEETVLVGFKESEWGRFLELRGPIARICVFGASAEVGEKYANSAKALGEVLGASSYGLIFGGFSVGLMKAVADGFSASGSEVIGVVPTGWNREIHSGCTQVIRSGNLAERKRKMIEAADAFIALPGGTGTFDECLK